MPTLTKGVAEWAAEGCLVKPLLLQWFQDQSIPFNFSIYIERSGDRKPDGWFHSSTHPLMPEDNLLYQLMFPELIVREPMGYTGCMGTMFGTVTHGVVGAALDQMGITVPLPDGPCPACGLPRPRKGHLVRKGQCGEHAGVHEETRSRGHLDKILDLDGLRGFDLKTRFKGGLRTIPDMKLEAFQEKWPGYYAQAQDYMRITGLRRYIVLFLEMGNPWEMREFHIDFDPVYAYTVIEAKYRRVLARAADAGVVLAA